MSHYDINLDKNDANYVPLTPLTFLERTKDIYPNYEAVVYESRSYTWEEVYKRCVKFASALDKLGIKTGDTVSVMAFNTPEIFEAHYSIPMVGAVINAINTRLDPNTISYILEHSDAKVLIVDRQFHEVIIQALQNVKNKITIIDIDDKDIDTSNFKKIGELEYESFLISGDNSFFKLSSIVNFSGSKDPEKYSFGGEDGLEETPIIEGSNEIKYAGTPSWYDFSIIGDYIINKKLKINFGAYNLFDFHYREFGSGISAPGRNIQIGLNWEP